jgi:hypothetical protein
VYNFVEEAKEEKEKTIIGSGPPNLKLQSSCGTKNCLRQRHWELPANERAAKWIRKGNPLAL